MKKLRLALAVVAALSVVAGAGACSAGVLPGETPAMAAPIAAGSKATAPAHGGTPAMAARVAAGSEEPAPAHGGTPAMAATVAAGSEEPAPVRIMPLGDSITYGIGSVRFGSYRVELEQRLRAAGVDVDFVGSQRSGTQPGYDTDNEGHSGWRIRKIAENVDGWISTYRPDVVLLHIGTNDMRSADEAVGAPGRLSLLIDQMLDASPDVQILVAKIVGSNDETARRMYSKQIDAYNAEIPGIVATKGPRVRLVDQTGVDGTDLLDRLHPNEFGYSKMAWTWYRALEPLLNTSGQAWPATGNPFQATAKYIRLFSPSGTEGRWWYLRPVTVERDGRTVTSRQWQTRRTVTERYRVKVNGQWVVRTRTVTRWSAT
ncbi:GDSL-type esterase/lipase family protein [Actinoplanes sp. NPDC049265]|uniref:SGNH/GDSL hydrolase family protein n=1 Tax=Actinoplanes sp. NPDC049265 TaxID=3363902 RepID=UPI003712DBF9